MATQSVIFARKIPWTEEPDRLQSIGMQRVRCNWSDWEQQACLVLRYQCTYMTWLLSLVLCLNFFKLINLFLLHWSSLLYPGFLWLPPAGATPGCGAWTSNCCGFSCCGVQALGIGTSAVVAHGLWSMLRSCGAFSCRLSCSTACEILVLGRNRTHVLCNGRQIAIHCTSREVLFVPILMRNPFAFPLWQADNSRSLKSLKMW